jgi:hypothetical protein
MDTPSINAGGLRKYEDTYEKTGMQSGYTSRSELREHMRPTDGSALPGVDIIPLEQNTLEVTF